MWAELMQVVGTCFTVVVLLIALYWLIVVKTLPEPTKVPALAKAVAPVKVKDISMDDVQFTVNVKDLVKALLNDPKCREEIYTAVREGAGPSTVPVGYSNLGDVDNHENQSMHISVSKDRPTGAEGYVHRSRDGRRVLIHLIPQQQDIKDALIRAASASPGDAQLASAIKNNPSATRSILMSLGYEPAFEE